MFFLVFVPFVVRNPAKAKLSIGNRELAIMRQLAWAASTVAWLVVAPTAAWSVDLRPGIPEGAVAIELDVVVQYLPDLATEFTPIDLVPFSDGTNRLAVSTVLGTIRVLDASRTMLPTPLLTRAQSGLVPPREAGMTGIAFHPDFNHAGAFGHGKLYTITTEPRTASGGPPDANVDFPYPNENYQDVIREWNLAAQGNVPGNASAGAFTGALADSREILRVDQPGPFHNVTDLTFNRHSQPGDADYGLLYVSAGDGGDESGEPPSSPIRRRRAQNLGNPYGKVLRIDPNPVGQAIQRTSANTGLPSYSVPLTNPFATDDAVESRTASTLAEVFASGFRSPFRIEFDRATGDLWLGDVGENAREEINRVVAGGNYGWGEMEGTLDGVLPGDGTTIPGLIRPVIELPRTVSRSIDGGFMYRGNEIPQLQGKYVFADLGQGFASAALFYAIVDPAAVDYGAVYEFQFSDGTPLFGAQPLPARIYSFGEDDAGELYFTAGPDPRQSPNPSLPAYIVKISNPGALTGVMGDIDQNGAFDPIADVAAFVLGWNTTGHIGAYDQYRHGDMNFDGQTNLSDVFLLQQVLRGAGATFPFSALGIKVPEPTAAGLACLAALVGVARRRVQATLHPSWIRRRSA
jgi:hypothetical protein